MGQLFPNEFGSEVPSMAVALVATAVCIALSTMCIKALMLYSDPLCTRRMEGWIAKNSIIQCTRIPPSLRRNLGSR